MRQLVWSWLLITCLVGNVVYGAEDRAVLLLKGSANFIPDTKLLPKKLDSVLIDGVTKPSSGAPWDSIVYGKKRSSYTVFSYESWYPDAISDHVGALNPFVQWRLAAAILASGIVGDESLHVGHFFAKFDNPNEKNIVDIIRTDLNARERFGKARQEKKQQSPYHASSFYQKSGQYNKDYVSYLLADKTLDLIYTMLWVNLASKRSPGETIKKESQKEFRQQLDKTFQEEIAKVPEKDREKSVSDILVKKKGKAILDVLAIINQDANEPLRLDKARPESSIADIVSSLDAQRAVAMMKEATAKYDAYINGLQAQVLKLKLTPQENLLRLDALRLTDKIVKRNESEGDLKQTIDNFNTDLVRFSCRAVNPSAKFPKCTEDVKLTSGFFNRIVIDGKIALALAEATYLIQNFPSDPEGRIVNGEIRRLQTVIDLAEYAEKVQSEDRKMTARLLINKVLSYPAQFAVALENRDLTDTIALNKGVLVNTTNKTGKRVIDKLRARHKEFKY